MCNEVIKATSNTWLNGLHSSLAESYPSITIFDGIWTPTWPTLDIPWAGQNCDSTYTSKAWQFVSLSHAHIHTHTRRVNSWVRVSARTVESVHWEPPPKHSTISQNPSTFARAYVCVRVRLHARYPPPPHGSPHIHFLSCFEGLSSSSSVTTPTCATSLCDILAIFVDLVL